MAPLKIMGESSAAFSMAVYGRWTFSLLLVSQADKPRPNQRLLCSSRACGLEFPLEFLSTLDLIHNVQTVPNEHAETLTGSMHISRRDN